MAVGAAHLLAAQALALVALLLHVVQHLQHNKAKPPPCLLQDPVARNTCMKGKCTCGAATHPVKRFARGPACARLAHRAAGARCLLGGSRVRQMRLRTVRGSVLPQASSIAWLAAEPTPAPVHTSSAHGRVKEGPLQVQDAEAGHAPCPPVAARRCGEWGPPARLNAIVHRGTRMCRPLALCPAAGPRSS